MSAGKVRVGFYMNYGMCYRCDGPGAAFACGCGKKFCRVCYSIHGPACDYEDQSKDPVPSPPPHGRARRGTVMKFCDMHWTRLRGSIEKYGLSELVAESGEQLAESIMRDAKGENTVMDFDPLMGAHNMLLGLSTNFTGSSVLLSPDHKCPACELEKYNWCEGAAWQARLEAERRGLVPVDRSDLSADALVRTDTPTEGEAR